MLNKLNNEYKDWHWLGVHEGFMYEPEWSVPYLSGRYRSILAIYPNIRVVLTEFGVDYIEDVIKRYPGINIRGWKQHVDYWKGKGVENPQQYMLAKFKYLLDTVYSDENVEGVNLFSYGDSGGWDLYNFEDAHYFINNMEQLEMETVITVGNEVLIRAATSDGTNRRTGAGTNFQKNGAVTKPVLVKELQKSNGWTQYRFSDGDFWVKDEFIVVAEAGSNIVLRLYDATPTEIERVNFLIEEMQELSRLFSKLRVEIE